MADLELECATIDGRSYQIGTERYANCYVSTETFNIILECRGIDTDDYVDDCIDVRGIFTLKEVATILVGTDNEDIVKIKDCIKLLENNTVQYITFAEEI